MNASTAVARPSYQLNTTHLYYSACLTAVVIGYYGYWIAWQIRWFYLGIAGAFVLSVLFVAFANRDTKGLLTSLLPLLIWEGYLALSTTWAPNPDVSRAYLITLIFFPMAFVVGYVWLRHLNMWRLSSFLPIMALVQLPIIAWTLYTIGNFYDVTRGAVRTEITATTLFAVPFLTWRARNGGGSKISVLIRYGWIALALLLLASTGSRTGPVLGIIALVGTLTFAQPPKGRKIRAFLRSLAALAVIGLLAFAIPRVREGVVGVVDRLATQTAFSWADYSREDRVAGPKPVDFDRRIQVVVSLRSFREHPWRGDWFWSAFSITEEMLGYPIAAHGLIFFLLGETGLIGATIFAWLLFVFFKRVGRAVRFAASREQRGFWVTCMWTMIAMILMGLFHHIEQTAAFYVVLAWGYAAGYRIRTDLAPAGPVRGWGE